VKREPAGLPGAWLLPLQPYEDERGFFARLWSVDEFRASALTDALQQCSLSYNRHARTIRGLHYQAAPRTETKIVRCVRGAIYDVLLDLRPESATFRQWVAHELTDSNRLALYVPKGVAHGYQTLTDDAEVLYLIDERYDPSLARGVRWNDRAFGIGWPLPAGTISERDRSFPDFAP
jgi:dTDP-4-dehydrorhamnose 3,5-epimerase